MLQFQQIQIFLSKSSISFQTIYFEIEFTKIQKLITKTIPVVIGVLGMIKDTENYINQIPVCDQARATKKNGWLSNLNLKQLKDK